jgi:hypothetical protein
MNKIALAGLGIAALAFASPANADTAHYLNCIKHNTMAGVSFPFDDNTAVKIGIEAYHATGGPPQTPGKVNPEIQSERGSGECNCAVRDLQQRRRAGRCVMEKAHRGHALFFHGPTMALAPIT